MKLYEVNQKLLELEAQIEASQGEVSDEILAEYLQSQADLEKALLDAGKWILNRSAEIKAIKAEEERLANRRSTLEKGLERFKEYAASVCYNKGISKVKDDLVSITISLTPPAVKVIDEGMIPQEFKVEIPATWRVDKTAVKEAIQTGKEVPGATLTQRPMLKIK